MTNPVKISHDPGSNLTQKSHDPGSNSVEKSHDPVSNLVEKSYDPGVKTTIQTRPHRMLGSKIFMILAQVWTQTRSRKRRSNTLHIPYSQWLNHFRLKNLLTQPFTFSSSSSRIILTKVYIIVLQLLLNPSWVVDRCTVAVMLTSMTGDKNKQARSRPAKLKV